MEAAADEENRMQRFYKDEMKKTWQHAIENKHIDRVPDFAPEKFGISSFQRFSGEDQERQTRIKKQKEQMKKWVQERAAENAFNNYQESEERMKYAELLREIDAG